MDSTPERLKAFRAETAAIEASRGSRVLIVAVVVVVVAAAAAAGSYILAQRSRADTGGLRPGQQREYAAYLAEKNLPTEALTAYEEYLAKATLNDEERAAVCFATAQLAIDVASYERGLAHLYQAELLAPESSINEEVRKKIVFCLDKLGRSGELRRELQKHSNLGHHAKDVVAGEVVLAEFGDQVITDRDLEREIEQLPAAARGAMATPEKREELLRTLVAERLLLDKAFEQGLQNDPDIEAELTKERDSLMVRKLINEEVQSKLHVTPEDVSRFYQAEIGRFTQPAMAQVKVARAESKEAAASIAEFPGQPVAVRQGAPAPGVPIAPAALAPIFATEVGARTEPMEAGSSWYVFHVVSKLPEQAMPFEQVKDQAERMLRNEKQKEYVNAMIEETLRSRNAKLHADRLKGMPSP